jgi:large subunit ribosomal protein L4
MTLPKEIFGVKVNESLMAQAVRVYLSNQRKAQAKTKSRSEVRGSRRKIWRQKGTGRARHGDRFAPIFVGGGRAHGPTGEQNYKLKMSKKMKKQALFSALTSQLKAGNVLVVKGLAKTEPKAKPMAALLHKLCDDKKSTLVLPSAIKNVIRATNNLEKTRLAQASLLNAYEVLNGGKLVLMAESIEVLKSTFLKKSKKEPDKQVSLSPQKRSQNEPKKRS